MAGKHQVCIVFRSYWRQWIHGWLRETDFRTTWSNKWHFKSIKLSFSYLSETLDRKLKQSCLSSSLFCSFASASWMKDLFCCVVCCSSNTGKAQSRHQPHLMRLSILFVCTFIVTLLIFGGLKCRYLTYILKFMLHTEQSAWKPDSATRPINPTSRSATKLQISAENIKCRSSYLPFGVVGWCTHSSSWAEHFCAMMESFPSYLPPMTLCHRWMLKDRPSL